MPIERQLVLESNLGKLSERLAEFSERDFVNDLRPFVPVNEREKLPALFSYIKQYLIEKTG